MHHALFTGHSSIRIAHGERARLVWLAERRKYNRIYMRAWRARPANLATERRNRARWHYERKVREALRHESLAGDEAQVVCGFCRKQAPVAQVWRLEICDLAPRGYAEVRVPYCGEC